MIATVEWSVEASHTFTQIVTQIKEKWTNREVESFIERTQQVINFIGQNPSMYPFSKKGDVHRAVITKHTSLYYHMPDVNKVVLLSFEDNRQDPSELTY